MDEFGANIVIAPKTEGLSLSYGGMNVGGVSFDLKEIAEKDLAALHTIENAENIRIVSPKVFGVFEHQGRKGLVVGVDFESELALKSWWNIRGRSPSTDHDLLVGSEAADKLGLDLGSSVLIKDEKFQVVGVIESTGSQDDNLAFMSLPLAQGLFDKRGTVAMVEVAALCKNCPISEIVRQISAELPDAKVTAVQQVVQGRMDTLGRFRQFSLVISGMMLLVGSMVVFVTMMSSVNERTREIGIFSAIGFRRSHIMRIILLEALMVSIAAGIIGYGVGIGGTRMVLPLVAGETGHFALDPLIGAGAVFLSVIIGLAASLYPALTASRMDPNEALRTL
jgi:putative ABC transport system permease protein